MKNITEKTLLQKLRDDLDDCNHDEWVDTCMDEISQKSRLELADLLRDISVELRAHSTISEDDRDSLEKLKKLILNQTLALEQKASITKIETLTRKLDDVPDDILQSIQARLEEIKRDVLSDNRNSSMQDRVARSAKAGRTIDELNDQFELEYKHRTLDADMADREQARKVKGFDTIVQKDSIANLLGGILLVVFSIVLVITIFLETKAESLKIIESAFLILLGFFFGQNAKANKSAGGKK